MNGFVLNTEAQRHRGLASLSVEMGFKLEVA